MQYQNLNLHLHHGSNGEQITYVESVNYLLIDPSRMQTSSSPEDLDPIPIDLRCSQTSSSFIAHLGCGYSSESITVSQNARNYVNIVAARWELKDNRTCGFMLISKND